jgi:hypothetical protein
MRESTLACVTRNRLRALAIRPQFNPAAAGENRESHAKGAKVTMAGGSAGKGCRTQAREKRQGTAAVQKLAHLPTHPNRAKRRGVRQSSAALNCPLLIPEPRLQPEPAFDAGRIRLFYGDLEAQDALA